MSSCAAGDIPTEQGRRGRSSRPTMLTARIVAGEDQMIVLVRGEVDLTTSGVLRDALQRAAGSGQRIVIDLSDVSFMDLRGADAIIDAFRSWGESTSRVSVRRANRTIRMLFAVIGLDRVIEGDGATVTSLG